MENYREIPGYEGKYAVSDLGNVKNLKTGRILKPGINTRGYLQVGLSIPKPRRVQGYRVHVLVAMAFLGHQPDPTREIVIDHINANKADNRLANLQIVTQRHNVSKAYSRNLPTGVYNHTKGRYVARLNTKGQNFYLGIFNTIEEASEAYQNAISKFEI